MDANTKWNNLKEYLTSQQETVLSHIKISALGETPNELRAFGAQLALIETILTQVERLDQDKKHVEGRPAPPRTSPKY